MSKIRENYEIIMKALLQNSHQTNTKKLQNNKNTIY